MCIARPSPPAAPRLASISARLCCLWPCPKRHRPALNCTAPRCPRYCYRHGTQTVDVANHSWANYFVSAYKVRPINGSGGRGRGARRRRGQGKGFLSMQAQTKPDPVQKSEEARGCYLQSSNQDAGVQKGRGRARWRARMARPCAAGGLARRSVARASDPRPTAPGLMRQGAFELLRATRPDDVPAPCGLEVVVHGQVPTGELAGQGAGGPGVGRGVCGGEGRGEGWDGVGQGGGEAAHRRGGGECAEEWDGGAGGRHEAGVSSKRRRQLQQGRAGSHPQRLRPGNGRKTGGASLRPVVQPVV